MNDDDENRMLTCAEAARLLGLHVNTIRKLVREGELESWRPFAHTVRVPYKALLDFIEAKTAAAAGVGDAE